MGWISGSLKILRRSLKNELNEWTQDEKLWPGERTYSLFNEWFNAKHFGVLYDLEEKPISKIN